MPSVGTLVVNVVANTKGMDRGFSKASRAIGKFSKGLGAAGAAITAYAVTAQKLFQTNEGIERSMRQSLALFKEVAGFQRAQMKDAAIEVAGQTTFSAKEAADAYYFLASAGQTAGQAIESLPAVANFAMAGHIDLAKATNLSVGALNALKLASPDPTKNMENMVMIQDKLMVATQNAQATTEEFAIALTRSGGAMAKAGYSVDQALPLLGAFAKMNIKGEEAATAFQITMREMERRYQENTEAWESKGIDVYDDSTGKVRNMSLIIGELTEAFSHLAPEMRFAEMAQLGFQEKSRKYIDMLIGMEGTIGDLENKVKDYAGTTEDMAKNKMTPFQNSWKNLNKVWNQLSSDAGPGISNVFSMVIDKVSSILAFFGKKGSEVGGLAGGISNLLFGDTTPILAFADILHEAHLALAAVVPTLKSIALTAAEVVLSVLKSIGKVASKIPGLKSVSNEFVAEMEAGQAHLDTKWKNAWADFNELLTAKTPSEKFREEQERNAAAAKKAGEEAKAAAAAAAAATALKPKAFPPTVKRGFRALGGMISGASALPGKAAQHIGKTSEAFSMTEERPDHHNRVNKALEKGSMEAYKAARNSQRDNQPQRQIQVNTKKMVDVQVKTLEAIKEGAGGLFHQVLKGF